jgi:hypothetical protein
MTATPVTSMNFDNKIVLYLFLTALMVVTFVCALLITSTRFGTIGWLTLLVINLGMLFTILRK